MDETQIKALQEAAADPDPARLTALARSMELAAVDRARGVEDTTRGLREKNEELFRKDRERSVEMEALRGKAAELDELRTAQEAQEAQVAAEAVGASAEEIDRLAEEKAAVKVAALKTTWEEKHATSERNLVTAQGDIQVLRDKLRTAMVDHLIFRGGGSTCDPLAFKHLRSEAAPYFRPKTLSGDGASSEEDWWKQELVSFEIIDPDTGTLLQNGENQPMAPVDLISSKKADGTWAWFFPNTSQGGGMSSAGGTLPGAAPGRDATAIELFGSILTTPS